MMNTEELLMLEQAKAQVEAASIQNEQLTNQNQRQNLSMEQQDMSMAEAQLNVTKELNRIEHILKGHILKEDKNTGLSYWDTAVDMSKHYLSEEGVRDIMEILNMYVSQVGLLANYTEEEVNKKMYRFSTELADFTFTKSSQLGMDNSEKQKHYSMLNRMLIDFVHHIYSRALGGKERDSIRKRWNLNEQVGSPIGNLQGGNNSSPKNWLRA